jgi:hypothetical protein
MTRQRGVCVDSEVYAYACKFLSRMEACYFSDTFRMT